MEAGAGGSEEGFELFDKQKLGASDFQQKVTYQRALEGEIANTIKRVQGVTGVQVQLVLPEEDLFADKSSPATAAVMLAGSSDELESGAVRGIAQLVSSSVKGLKTENVTITDGSRPAPVAAGRRSAPAAARAGRPSRRPRCATSAACRPRLDALLSQHARPGQGPGPGQGRPQRGQDDAADELTYAKKGMPLKETTETEQLKGGGSTGGGAAGTGANIPHLPPGRGAAPAANSNYERRPTTTELRRRQDGHAHAGGAGRRQAPAGGAAARQVGPARRSPASRRRSRARPASTPSAAT